MSFKKKELWVHCSVVHSAVCSREQGERVVEEFVHRLRRFSQIKILNPVNRWNQAERVDEKDMNWEF